MKFKIAIWVVVGAGQASERSPLPARPRHTQAQNPIWISKNVLGLRREEPDPGRGAASALRTVRRLEATLRNKGLRPPEPLGRLWRRIAVLLMRVLEAAEAGHGRRLRKWTFLVFLLSGLPLLLLFMIFIPRLLCQLLFTGCFR